MSDTATVTRSQMFKHEDFVQWATEQGLLKGGESPAQTIAVFAANRNAYRKTPRYLSLREAGDPTKAERDAARQAEKEQKAAQRATERAEKQAAKEAAAAEKAAKAEGAATKAPPKEAVAAPAKATKKATKASKATPANPFD